MRCDCLCCVMSRDAMRCHVMCAHVMCPAMVTLCVRSGSVTMWWSKVLFCTTKYFSSTTLYYTVLLQYYSVLQSTTPVLPCTAKYYSSTTLYCKVLLQYYSSTTLYYTVLQRTTPVLLCTTISITPVLLCTATVMIDPRHIWNVIYNARSNRSHNPTSPNTAPATQNESHDWSESHMKRHLQCAEQQESQSNFTKHCTCHSKWISWLIRIRYETSFTMRGATRVTLQPHQILCLPRKMNLIIDPPHIWNVIYNARSNKSHTTTSPYTAPATQNESHDWSASHMKRHLQCAEQQTSNDKFTKYCACHAKWISWLIRVTYETSFPMRGASNVTL